MTRQTYPRRFGRYVLVEPLSRGGMGEIHLAVTGGGVGMQKLCVIKQILPELADEEYAQRFIDEATVMGRLSHGNLVPVLESGKVDGQYFLAMEYIEGRNLRELWNEVVGQGRPFPLRLALYLVKELCRGLGFAHTVGELGLVHRDVSPPNVLLSWAGEVRLTDFGLALSTLKVQKTSPGILLGKLPYMSPEQARGEALDRRSDLFAVGVILWELITGRRRFAPESSQADQLRWAMDPEMVPPTRIVPDLPPALDLITQRALAPGVEERFADAEVLRREIAKVLAEVDPTTDASTLQRFLDETYGEAIKSERQTLERRLSARAERIDALLAEAQGTAGAANLSDVLSDLEDEAPGRKRRDPTTEITPGVTLDEKYLVHEMIGQGGMGKVYKATHLGIERTVALKILLPEYSSIDSVVDRFQMEARAANRVGHSNVVEIFDSGTTSSGLLYYAMEFLEGTDLADLLFNDRTLEVNQTLRIGVQICEAMDAAHEAGVIHRDLKPENIYLVVREGKPDFVKVVDFGIARLEGGRSHTLPGLAVGTPEYMSPEQASSGLVDRRSDIYALGVMLYEMLVGQVPKRPVENGVPGPIPSIRERRDDVPEELEQLIFTALAADPDARPATMGRLAYDLRRLLEGRAAAVASVLNISGQAPALVDAAPTNDSGEFEPIMATMHVRPYHRGPRRQGVWRWLPYAMTGAAVLLAAVAVVILLGRDRGGEARPTAAPAATAPDAGHGASVSVTRPRPGDAGLPQTPSKAATRRRRPRRRSGRKPQRKAVRLEGTLDPFAK